MTRRLALVLLLALTAAACGGDARVASVNGSDLKLSDIPVEPDGFDVAQDIFLNALNWEILDRVLLSAAEAELGITLDATDVAASAAQILAGLPSENQSDPRANLAYFETQARVARSVGLLWPLVGEALGDEVATNNWINSALRNADVTVARRFGVWRVDPEPLVYPE